MKHYNVKVIMITNIGINMFTINFSDKIQRYFDKRKIKKQKGKQFIIK
jgi:hypothetical protein